MRKRSKLAEQERTVRRGWAELKIVWACKQHHIPAGEICHLCTDQLDIFETLGETA